MFTAVTNYQINNIEINNRNKWFNFSLKQKDSLIYFRNLFYWLQMLLYWKIFLFEYNMQEVLLCVFSLLTSQSEIIVTNEQKPNIILFEKNK